MIASWFKAMHDNSIHLCADWSASRGLTTVICLDCSSAAC